MRFTITLEVEVDIVAWGDEYGVRGPEVKPDVLGYVQTLVDYSYAKAEHLIEVTGSRISAKRPGA